VKVLFEDSMMLNLGSDFFIALATATPERLVTVGQLLSTRLSKNMDNATPLIIFQAEIPRLSRAVGHLLKVAWTSGDGITVEEVVSSIRHFCDNLLKDWQTCGMGDRTDKESVEFSNILFSHFRLCLFSVTMIFKSVLEALEDQLPYVDDYHGQPHAVEQDPEAENRPPMSATPAMASRILGLMLKSFAGLHFITCRFGADGFKTWNTVFSGSVDLLKDLEKAKKQEILGEEVQFVKPVELIMDLLPAYKGLHGE
jgi:hypothetical protein